MSELERALDFEMEKEEDDGGDDSLQLCRDENYGDLFDSRFLNLEETK